MHVPPAYPSDGTEAIGASPILPSKQNPVFRFSTKQFDAIQKCRPYPSVTRNIDPLIAHLGIDESVIARRLESSARERVIEPRAHSNNFRVPNTVAPPLMQPPRPDTRDESCQTPVLACAKCEKRLDNLMNTQTQTAVIEKVAKPSQTLETDFTLSKLRWMRWEKEQKRKVKDFSRDYPGVVSDEEENDDDFKSRTSPVRAPVGPPGYREQPKKSTATSSTSSNNNYEHATAKRYHDRYYQGPKY